MRPRAPRQDSPILPPRARRRRELYYKDLTFDSLGELFLEFKRSYERVFHTLKRVRVGLPMSHDTLAGEPVCWSYLTAKCSDAAAAAQLLADHGRTAHRLHEQWRVEVKKAGANGQKPPAPPKKQGSSGEGGKAAAGKGKGAADDGAKKGVGGGSIIVAGSDSDSSDGGGAAAPAAAAPSAAPPAATASKDLGDAADAPAGAAPAAAARPSFLSV